MGMGGATTEVDAWSETTECVNGHCMSEKHKEHAINGNVIEKADIFDRDGYVTGQQMALDPMGRPFVSAIQPQQSRFF